MAQEARMPKLNRGVLWPIPPHRLNSGSFGESLDCDKPALPTRLAFPSGEGYKQPTRYQSTVFKNMGVVKFQFQKRLFSSAEDKVTMLNDHVSDAQGNGRVAPFLDSNFQRYSAWIGCCILAFLFVVSTSARLSAQTSGTISGHVSDSTGAVIPGANVTLTNLGTGASRSTVTTGAGDYTFPDVPPANYKVQVTHEGFKTATSQSVELDVQQSLRQDFTMAVGAVTQPSRLQATGELLQAENATLGTVIENAGGQRDATERQKLPVAGCAFVQRQHAVVGIGPGRLAPRRRPRQPGDLGRRPAHHVRLLHARWREQYRSRLQYLYRAAFPRRHPGVQGADGRLSAEFGHEATQVNVL